MSYEAPFPHCDSRVLHAPSECVYCDHYPEAQAARIRDGINFTGRRELGLATCPAELARPLGVINRWHGNVAQTFDDIERAEADWRQVSDAILVELSLTRCRRKVPYAPGDLRRWICTRDDGHDGPC